MVAHEILVDGVGLEAPLGTFHTADIRRADDPDDAR